MLRNFAPAASGVAVAQDLTTGQSCWLIQLPLTCSAVQLHEALERQGRFGLGVPGLARPLSAGIVAGLAHIAFVAPTTGSIAEVAVTSWTVPRVAALAARIAAALAPLHDQGISYGLLMPELISEGPEPVLFGFGVTALASRFGAPGDGGQLVPPDLRAPELRESLQPPTPASDLFALATLLRGLLPPSISPEIAAHLARATAPDPRARPQDITTFTAYLSRLAEDVNRSRAPAELAAAAHAPAPALPVAAPAPAIAPPAALPIAVPPPMPVPAPIPIPPPAFQSSTPARSSLLAVVLVVSGLLLMVGGVGGALIYAARHAPPAKTAAATAAAPPLPAPPAPAPAPPEPEPTPPAAPEITLSPRPVHHPPIVAPGAGPSSFASDARAALPVLGSEPIWGTRNAALTWVLFGDLDCPHTRKAWRSLEAVKASFGDDLRIVFHHRPLREHPNALAAARVLAGVARVHGPIAFFDVLHRAVQGEASLSEERLSSELAAAGYGASKLSDLSAAGEAQVRADLQLAGQFGLKSTPFSFLNGLAIDGERSALELEQLLRDEQRTATWLTAAGVPSAALYATRTSSNLIGVGNAGESRSCAPVGKSPTRGPADALVTLVEFADFECQYCKRVEPTLEALLARYPKTLRLVWKDYPLPQHKAAQLLANFAADAYRRGSARGFWAIHDGMFAQVDALDEGTLGVLAGKAGLDGARLWSSAQAGAHDAAIFADMKLGQKLNVNGTPTFFANGRRIEGALPLERFDALIQEELRTAQRVVAHGTPARDLYALICD
ncbi:MAG TPA: thioredoxin domain-containing protein [Polyangiaceae bacterium]|nr:thioredoxin domain-containing protein [Polyangiaceae bacterium]